MTGARESRICRDWDFDDAGSFHLDQSREEAMCALEEFHARNAFAFEHAIRATRIANVFAG